MYHLVIETGLKAAKSSAPRVSRGLTLLSKMINNEDEGKSVLPLAAAGGGAAAGKAKTSISI